ncbi:hypothetical protein [uncultured Chryseobacterium sp.]|uniref:hypothetical protein n=1 Tax=uncultured Chryseobacterium sp. TaxID=259322 RepID=UPI002621E814|nr:hypothetical protein [uncultured Chryseobacterium sp.]
MKKILFLLFLIVINFSFSQKKLPIIKSNSQNVKIIESGEIITDWTLNPKLKPDVYTTGKIAKTKSVKLVTDIDSIEVKLKPKQKFDFIVLLKGKDSCHTTFESPEIVNFSKAKPVLRDTILFQITEFNNIKVKSVLNKKDTIFLTFDTGSIDFYLIKSSIKKFLNPEGKKLTMNDISDNHFKIGNLEWKHQQIYPIDTTGQETDGMFGWNAFDGKVLEIDYDKNLMIAHSKLPKISKDYERFDMELMREHFCIYLDLEQNGKKHKTRYLFDSGYQRAVMLDNDILKENSLGNEDFKLIKETKMYNSQNEEIPVKTVLLPKLHFGKYVLKSVPAQINSYNKPAGFKTNFLGNEILKRFNAILDFQNNVVYLKPNKHFKEEYAEKLN